MVSAFAISKFSTGNFICYSPFKNERDLATISEILQHILAADS